jgi:hypothetical protein
MPGVSANPEMFGLLAEAHSAASSATTLRSLQQTVVEVLSRELAHYSWVGFYMLDPKDVDTLMLGPFVGDPTPHVRIPVTQGICGAAVASGETVIVDNVNADPRICPARSKPNRRSLSPFIPKVRSSVRSTSIVTILWRLRETIRLSLKRLLKL